MDYQIEILRTASELQGFLPEWREFLAHAAPAPVFYQDPDVIRLFLEQQGPAVQPRLIVLRCGGRVVGLAPCFVEKARYRMRLSVLTLFTLPFRRLKVFGDTLLTARGENEADLLERLLEALRSLRREVDVVYLETLRMEGPLWSLLQREGSGQLRLMVSSPEPQVVREIRFGGSFDAYYASRPKKARNNYQWRLRKFEREAPGPPELARVTDPEQVPEFLAELDHLFNRTWQARSFGRRRRDGAEDLRYFTGLAELGLLRSYVLRSAGKPLAYVVGFQYGGRFHHEETGYDQDFAALAPGTILNYSLVRDLFEHRKPEVLDFGHGENTYKKVLGTDEYPVCSAYLVPRNRWRPVLQTQQALNAAYLGIRSALTRYGLDTAVRRAVKRKAPASVGEA